MKILQDNRGAWICLCGNASKLQGFYPVNSQGEIETRLWQRSDLYACFRCGRVIERGSLTVVGATARHKLAEDELLKIYADLQRYQTRNSRADANKVKEGRFKRILRFLLVIFQMVHSILLFIFFRRRSRYHRNRLTTPTTVNRFRPYYGRKWNEN